MSVNDPIIIKVWYHGFYVSQGREAFYNEDRRLRLFDNVFKAINWAMKEFPRLQIQDENGVVIQKEYSNDKTS